VVAVRLFDPLEMDLPDLGLLTVRDAETGEQLLVDTHDPAFAALRRHRRPARGRPARPLRAPAWTRWSWPPTTTCSTRCCALRPAHCAGSAAAAVPAATALRRMPPHLPDLQEDLP
jgi:hypothetical protein